MSGRRYALPFVALPCLLGCGGGAAMMHPAHTLPESRIAAGAGVSAEFNFERGTRAVDRAGNVTQGVDPSLAEQQFVESAVSKVAFGPGVAPWVGARVGVGGHNEAGLTYTGRTARLDARHAFEGKSIALSVGAGASALLLHPGSRRPETTPPAATAGRFTGEAREQSATGYGFDVPVIVGWRSTASVVEAWGGVRGGFERAWGNAPLARMTGEDPSAPVSEDLQADITAARWYGGGLVGAAVGIRPLWVVLELDVGFQSVTATATFPPAAGTPGERTTSLSGISLAPTGAIVGKF